MKTIARIGLALSVSGLLVVNQSCVSSKKYNELLDKQTKCAAQNVELEKSNQECNASLTESTALGKRLQSELDAANTELDTLRRNYLLTAADLAELQNSYANIDKQYKSTVSGKDALARQLSLRESELAEKEALLDEQARKLAELQGILDTKDKQMRELKERVTEALLGFQDKGLTIQTKNGKVYVSMDEKLLFSSGSWTVNPQGREALYEIANVMAKNPDIHLMVEGHTDNVPLRGKGDIKDNWDLSVKRATSIVKILLENKGVNPTNVSASGRSEYAPLVSNDSPENRSRNRRTEIILTPNLDELFQILETN